VEFSYIWQTVSVCRCVGAVLSVRSYAVRADSDVARRAQYDRSTRRLRLRGAVRRDLLRRLIQSALPSVL